MGGTGRRQGNAASRSGRGSRPTASQSPATARQARRSSGRSAIAVVSTTRVAPAANASWIASAESTPPATWSGTATRAATAPTVSRLAGDPARAPSKSTRWTSRAPRATNRSAMRSGPVGRRADAGSGARPEDDPRAARLQVDGRDDLHDAGQLPAVSSRRWKLTGSDPFRSSVSWNALRLKASPRRRCSSARNPSRSVRPSR